MWQETYDITPWSSARWVVSFSFSLTSFPFDCSTNFSASPTLRPILVQACKVEICLHGEVHFMNFSVAYIFQSKIAFLLCIYIKIQDCCEINKPGIKLLKILMYMYLN